MEKFKNDIVVYSDVCRCCLQENKGNNFMGLWDKYVYNGSVEVYGNMIIESFYMPWAQPDKPDVEQICVSCVSKVCDAFSFKKQLQAVDLQLASRGVTRAVPPAKDIPISMNHLKFKEDAIMKGDGSDVTLEVHCDSNKHKNIVKPEPQEYDMVAEYEVFDNDSNLLEQLIQSEELNAPRPVRMECLIDRKTNREILQFPEQRPHVTPSSDSNQSVNKKRERQQRYREQNREKLKQREAERRKRKQNIPSRTKLCTSSNVNRTELSYEDVSEGSRSLSFEGTQASSAPGSDHYMFHLICQQSQEMMSSNKQNKTNQRHFESVSVNNKRAVRREINRRYRAKNLDRINQRKRDNRRKRQGLQAVDRWDAENAEQSEDTSQHSVTNLTAAPNTSRTSADRQRQYRLRQKQKMLDNPAERTNILETKTEYQRQYRLQKRLRKAQNMNRDAPKKSRADYQREYRLRKKHRAALNSGSDEMIPKQEAEASGYLPMSAQLAPSSPGAGPLVIQHEAVIKNDFCQ